MARPRSPNYPSIGLGKAIEAMRLVIKRENRNKMSKRVLAKHLGSNTLNGRVLTRIGALRAYGLVEGPGDGMRVSDDAVVLLNAPEGAPERQATLERCAFRPNIFKRLREESPDLTTPPSAENLRYGLIKQGFIEEAAGKTAKSYLATIGLVSGNASLYDSDNDEDDSEGKMPQQSGEPGTSTRRTSTPPLTPPPIPPLKPGMQRADFPLAEGIARIEFPADMSPESYEDMDAWLKLVLRRAKRSVKTED